MTIQEEILNILFNGLKAQAEQYKTFAEKSTLSHDERKDFDNQISEIFDTLTKMTNTEIILSSVELEQLKLNFTTLYDEALEKLSSGFFKGEQGVQGEKGDKGDTGSQGVQGEKGDKGDTGSQGIQGSKGEQGIQGLKGDKGETGLQGIQGLKGEQGIQGVKGSDGVMTFSDLTLEQKQSLKGDKGETGLQGIQGLKGEQGVQGLKGEKGDKGETGSQGIQGLKGDTGAVDLTTINAINIRINKIVVAMNETFGYEE